MERLGKHGGGPHHGWHALLLQLVVRLEQTHSAARACWRRRRRCQLDLQLLRLLDAGRHIVLLQVLLQVPLQVLLQPWHRGAARRLNAAASSAGAGW